MHRSDTGIGYRSQVSIPSIRYRFTLWMFPNQNFHLINLRRIWWHLLHSFDDRAQGLSIAANANVCCDSGTTLRSLGVVIQPHSDQRRDIWTPESQKKSEITLFWTITHTSTTAQKLRSSLMKTLLCFSLKMEVLKVTVTILSPTNICVEKKAPVVPECSPV